MIMFISREYHQVLLGRIQALETLNHDLINRLLEKSGVPAIAKDIRTPEEIIKDLASSEGVDLFEEVELTTEQKRATDEDHEQEDELVETQP